MTALTNTAIEAMAPGDELKDDRLPGLTVRANRSGKSFLLRYRAKGGRTRRPKIGAWGVVSISKARELARDMLIQVAAGKDPMEEQQKHRTEPTVADLWEAVRKERYNQGKSWDIEAKNLYTRCIAPRLSRMRVSAVGYHEANEVHKAYRRAPVKANRILSVLSIMLTCAERYGWRELGSNPCQLVQRYRETHRERYAQPEEIAAIGSLLKRYAQISYYAPSVAFLYLLIFSGARPSEIGDATPDMLDRIERDGKVYGMLRLPEAKTGARDVFLPPQAMRVLDALPADRKRLAGCRNMPRRLWVKIRTEAGCPDLWARDWRRTFATTGLSSGMSLDLLGELLGHKSRETTMIYAKLMKDPAMTASADIADRVERMLAGG